MSDDKKSFFHSLPGLLTGIASLLAAITTLYLALKDDPKPAEQQKLTTPSQLSSNTGLTAEQLKHQKELAALQQKRDQERIKLERELLEIEKQKAALKKQAEERQVQNQNVDDSQSYASTSTPATHSVTGNWIFSNMIGSYLFVLQQDGEDIYLEQYDASGALVGEGDGIIQGKNVSLDWIEPYMMVTTISVSANLRLSPNGRRMSGQMQTPNGPVAMDLVKQGY